MKQLGFLRKPKQLAVDNAKNAMARQAAYFNP